jgi:hypothetical protein
MVQPASTKDMNPGQMGILGYFVTLSGRVGNKAAVSSLQASSIQFKAACFPLAI